VDLNWITWLAAGLVLMISELFFASFFVLWFGLGAVIVGVVMLAFPSMSFSAQMILWALSSLAFVVAWFKFFKPHVLKNQTVISQEAFNGEIGLVARDIKPYVKGLVQFQKPILGDDKWEAFADADIAAGERVRVESVDGNLLKVKVI
jgi:inner membrane protein